MQLAKDLGMKVECRQIAEEELATFEEAGACGTAAVISPIERIDDLDTKTSYVFSKDGKPGPVCTKLYQKLINIQYGIEEDIHVLQRQGRLRHREQDSGQSVRSSTHA